jgi:hypothetical protein
MLPLSMPILSRRFGLWKTIDDETGEAKSVVRIWNEQGQLSGKVEKIFSKPGKNPNTICEKCSGDRKDQPVIGMAILWGLTEDQPSRAWSFPEWCHSRAIQSTCDVGDQPGVPHARGKI